MGVLKIISLTVVYIQMAHEQILREVYYNPATGFTGATKLYKQVKGQGITMNQVRSFLGKQDIVQSTRKPNAKGSFIPQHKLHEIQMDLIYIKNPHLNKASYALTAIDIFTKKATAVLMKKKTEGEAVRAMKMVFKTLGVPKMLYSDRGSEFDNTLFKRLTDHHKISHIWTHTHAAFVERFNRTLKTLLFKYLESTGTKTITNVLPLILKNYNNSEHTTTEVNPNEAHSNDSTHDKVFANITKRAKVVKRPTLQAGDEVRTVNQTTNLQKRFENRFSTEVSGVQSEEVKEKTRIFKVLGQKHPYLRAHVRKVGERQSNPNKGLLKGTEEGRLTQKGGLKAQQKVFHNNADTTQGDDRKDEIIVRRSSRRRATAGTQAVINRLKSQGYG